MVSWTPPQPYKEWKAGIAMTEDWSVPAIVRMAYWQYPVYYQSSLVALIVVVFA